MHRAIPLALFALGLSGCSEHWFSHDNADLDVTIDPVVLVDARVVTPPGAWPRDLYDHAVRLGVDGLSVTFQGEVVDGVVTDQNWTIDDHWGDNVNVLNAWRGCDHAVECDRTFRFEVSCADGAPSCGGTVTADAFLAVELGPNQRERRGDDLTLELSVTEPANTSR